MEMIDKFFDAGGYDYLYNLEERYSCASICSVPLFYLSREVSEGSPTTDCFTAVVEDITDNKTAAIIFFVTAIVLLFAVMGTFPLCGKDSGESNEKTEKRKKNYQVDEPEVNQMA
jgi:hypothetical protein